MKKTIRKGAFLLLALLLTAGCEKSGDVSPADHTVKDPQGNVYRWQDMDDGRRWLAENLRYAVDDSWLYPEAYYPEGIPYAPVVYGRLYTWASARTACAALGDGWRLPTKPEWDALVDAYGDWDDDWRSAGGYSSLTAGGNSGFSARLGGYYFPPVTHFVSLGDGGYYWTATEHEMYAWAGWSCHFIRTVPQGELVRSSSDKTWGFSCRCIRDSRKGG